MEKVRYMISDAAALAGVETHVLRYWEEELDLDHPAKRDGTSILYTRKHTGIPKDQRTKRKRISAKSNPHDIT